MYGFDHDIIKNVTTFPPALRISCFRLELELFESFVSGLKVTNVVPVDQRVYTFVMKLSGF